MKHFVILVLAVLSLQLSAQNEVVSSLVRANTIEFDDEIIRDRLGNVYGSHFDGNSINCWSPDGSVRRVASGFQSPNGLTLDSQGNLFVADPSADRIYKLDTMGQFLDTIFMNKPAGLQKMGGSDTILVTSWQNNKVLKLAPDGSFADYIVGRPLNGPFALAYDATTDQYYVGNFNNREVFKIDSDTLKYVATVPSPTAAADRWLGGMVATNNTIWASSMTANRIYKVFPDYIDSVQLFAGGAVAGHLDGPIDSATFTMPNGLWINAAGDSLYVTEYNAGYLRLIYEKPTTTGSWEDRQEGSLKLYPNPANEVIHVFDDEVNWLQAVFMDAQGREVYGVERDEAASSWEIQVNHLPKGAYWLRLENQRSSHLSKLLIE